MYVYIDCMATKTIAIMDDAYQLLAQRKHKNESFSDVIRKLAGKKTDIMKFAGVWKDISETDAEDMKKNIIHLRKKSTQELLR